MEWKKDLITIDEKCAPVNGRERPGRTPKARRYKAITSGTKHEGQNAGKGLQGRN